MVVSVLLTSLSIHGETPPSRSHGFMFRQSMYTNPIRSIERIAKGEDQSIDTNDLALRQRYDRSVENQRFPYRTHLQWWRACYGLLGCTLMVIFNGWRTFVRPMNTSTFIASYISVYISKTPLFY